MSAPSRGWAGLVLLLALVPGCLLPQEDHILGDLPPEKNQPPRILESLLQPSGRFVLVRNGVGCPDLSFLAPVSDPDVNDTLIYNFYIDPDVDPAFVKQSQLSNNGLPDRPDPATLEVSFATTGPLQRPGEHIVEVLVSDGKLVNRDPQPQPVRLPDGGTVLDTTYAVTYAWVVTVSAGGCP